MGPRRWARVGGTPPGQHFDHEGLEDERGSGSVKSPPHKAPGEREREMEGRREEQVDKAASG